MNLILIFLSIISAASLIALLLREKELKKIRQAHQSVTLKYEKLAELNQKKKSIISTVLHDVSTPFATIDMWLQLLKGNNKNLDEEQKKAICVIDESALFGQKLIRKIASLENAIPGKLSISLFNFSALVASIINAMTNLPQRGVRIISNIEAGIFLLSDEAMIKKMCESLLFAYMNNAKDDTEVHVMLRKEKQESVFEIKIEVIDAAKASLSNLFSDYKQISSSKTEAIEISEMMIAQRIIAELNGKIVIENSSGISRAKVIFRSDSLR